MLLYGVDSSNAIKPMLVDSSGRVIVTSSSPSSLVPSPIFAVLSNPALPAGVSTQIIYTVPAGQVSRLTYMSVRYTGTVAGVTLNVRLFDGTNSILIDDVVVPVSGLAYPYNVQILLNAGHTVRCAIIGATAGDQFYGSATLDRIQ